MQTPGKQAFIVTLSGSRPVHEVTEELTKRGFQVGNVLDTIGVVTGSADADAVERLRGLPGVADISEDHPVDIGPPGSPIS